MIASLLVLAALSAPAADAAPVVQHRIYIVERTLAPGRAPDEALAALMQKQALDRNAGGCDTTCSQTALRTPANGLPVTMRDTPSYGAGFGPDAHDIVLTVMPEGIASVVLKDYFRGGPAIGRADPSDTSATFPLGGARRWVVRDGPGNDGSSIRRMTVMWEQVPDQR